MQFVEDTQEKMVQLLFRGSSGAEPSWGQRVLLVSAMFLIATIHVGCDVETKVEPLPTEMVAVTSGSFTMGCSDALDQMPIHEVSLSGFRIDLTETTQAAYDRCVDAGVCGVATCANNAAAPQGASLAAVCVSWIDAQTYCQWRGGRLPTEAEWEKAARGTDGRQYPWGDEEPDCTRTNALGCAAGPEPVGSRPAGASSYGVLDMAGSVWEWVADWYGEGYYGMSPAADPSGPAVGSDRVIRGGSVGTGSPVFLRSHHRDRSPPDARVLGIGFRCAVSD